MDNNRINNIENIVSSWLKSSDDNFEEMNDFFKIGRNNWALFLGHLCLEKLLKAYYVQVHHQHSPNLHNLMRIGELANIELSKEQKADLAMITTFNIAARYDDYKNNFYKKCTPEFTETWIAKIIEYRLWIKELIQ